MLRMLFQLQVIKTLVYETRQNSLVKLITSVKFVIPQQCFYVTSNKASVLQHYKDSQKQCWPWLVWIKKKIYGFGLICFLFATNYDSNWRNYDIYNFSHDTFRLFISSTITFSYSFNIMSAFGLQNVPQMNAGILNDKQYYQCYNQFWHLSLKAKFDIGNHRWLLICETLQ